MIPKWIASIINKDDVFINGDGETSRDFCFIDNAVQMNLISALTNDEEAKDQVYNCALNDQTSLNDLFIKISQRLVAEITGLKVKAPIHKNFRQGDVRHSLADISKAMDLLGYRPSHEIDDGLDESIDWYLRSIE